MTSETDQDVFKVGWGFYFWFKKGRG